jgi:hypothetical protein
MCVDRSPSLFVHTNDTGTLTLTNSMVSGNTSNNSGGGIHNDFAPVTLTNSTVSGNTTNGSGGGIHNSGTLTLTNSTVSGNTSNSAAGGGIYNTRTLTLTNSTVSGNTSNNWGGGIYNGSTMTLTNILIDDGCFDGGTITSGGGNIESPGDTCGFDQATDQVNVTGGQLVLGPLQDNGGPTMTHALLPGSVAIDWIPEAMCLDAVGDPLTTDQRGEPRPGGAMCDVGAFEVQP